MADIFVPAQASEEGTRTSYAKEDVRGGQSQPSALREDVSSPASFSAARRSADRLLMRAKLACRDSHLTAKVTVIVQIRERLVVSRKRNMMGQRAVRNANYFYRQTRESPAF